MRCWIIFVVFKNINIRRKIKWNIYTKVFKRKKNIILNIFIIII